MVVIILEGPLICWRSHAGYGRKSFNPLYKEREYVQWQIRKQFFGDVIDEPVSITYYFDFPVPKNTGKNKRQKMLSGEILPTIKKDGTNLQKFYEDCLKGIVIRDDCLVTDWRGRRRYAEKPSVTIIIDKLSDTGWE